MSEVSYPIEMIRGVPVVAAPEEIDIGNAGLLRAALLQVAAHGYATVVLDLSRTRFCDSAGLTVLIRAHKGAIAEGGELRLVVGTPQVQRILTVTGLRQLLRYFPSVTAAVAELPAAAIRPSHQARRVLPAGLAPAGNDGLLARQPPLARAVRGS